ncbi:hypothetical protein COMNV_00527 [Commensalibacter sp. Nvir]|uniref:hypothetical protein n=1 Tax=Commensalibacter sp. Nvir TaxID=3069817 RepID=UPI002D730104|nr:hypothetical protein COMNV_00527 [Commensalibacter sp. Nvir]
MSVNINIKISEDKTKLALGFLSDGLETKKIELSQKELEDFIRVLGTMRWAMAEGQKIPDIAGAKLVPAKQVKWAVQVSEGNDSTLLAFQHPAYGPVGFMLGDKEIKEYFEAVQKIIEIKKLPSVENTDSKVVSSRKDDRNIMTTSNSRSGSEQPLEKISETDVHTRIKTKAKKKIHSSRSKLKNS